MADPLDPCPFDPSNDRRACRYRGRCHYFARSGASATCLAVGSEATYLGRMVAAYGVLLPASASGTGAPGGA